MICMAFLLFSCTSNEQEKQRRNASNAPGAAGSASQPASSSDPGLSLQLLPVSAVHGSTVNLMCSGFNIQDARIEWLLNGQVTASASPVQFTLDEARKGDTLQARAIVGGKDLRSNTVAVVNALPEITAVKLLPEVLKPGDILRAEASASDADGDNISFLYEWTINDQPAGSKDRLETPLKRGDRISLRVTPYDSEGNGRSQLLNREIPNQPPVIQPHKEFAFDGTTYTYQVKASDADGDALAYTLEGAAEGMTIDSATGLLTWRVPAEFKGAKTVTAVVTDGNGGTASYVLTLTILQSSPGTPAPQVK